MRRRSHHPCISLTPASVCLQPSSRRDPAGGGRRRPRPALPSCACARSSSSEDAHQAYSFQTSTCTFLGLSHPVFLRPRWRMEPAMVRGGGGAVQWSQRLAGRQQHLQPDHCCVLLLLSLPVTWRGWSSFRSHPSCHLSQQHPAPHPDLPPWGVYGAWLSQIRAGWLHPPLSEEVEKSPCVPAASPARGHAPPVCWVHGQVRDTPGWGADA